MNLGAPPRKKFQSVVILLATALVMTNAFSETPAAPVTVERVPQAMLLEYLADHGAFLLIDARSPGEYAESHIDGAINIPYDIPDEELALSPDLEETVVVYCRSGRRATLLTERLKALGYTNVHVLGPDQIAWSDGLATFNCAATASSPSDKLSGVEPVGASSEDTL